MKNSKNTTAGQGMQAKAVTFNPNKATKSVRKLVMSPSGSLCSVEDMRNPNA